MHGFNYFVVYVLLCASCFEIAKRAVENHENEL